MGVTLKTLLPCILLCCPSGCLQTLYLSSHSHSLSSILHWAIDPPLPRERGASPARAWWPIPPKQSYKCVFCFVCLILYNPLLVCRFSFSLCRFSIMFLQVIGAEPYLCLQRGSPFVIFHYCLVSFLLLLSTFPSRNLSFHPIDGR